MANKANKLTAEEAIRILEQVYRQAGVYLEIAQKQAIQEQQVLQAQADVQKEEKKKQAVKKAEKGSHAPVQLTFLESLPESTKGKKFVVTKIEEKEEKKTPENFVKKVASKKAVRKESKMFETNRQALTPKSVFLPSSKKPPVKSS